jgi:chorismate dehydratase
MLDHPSALCSKLAHGELDVALVSSFEFLRNPIYRIVDGVSISSDGPVYSVVVAHQGKFRNIRQIALDPAAETSGNLLRCLVNELNLRPLIGLAPSTAESSARLLIGDQAIRFRQRRANEFEFWDLGEQWKKLRALPFVYAVWLVRPEVKNPEAIADCLRALCDQNLSRLDDLIASEQEFDRAFCTRYYRQNLRFKLGDNEKKGLRAFAESCQTLELLPKLNPVLDLV